MLRSLLIVFATTAITSFSVCGQEASQSKPSYKPADVEVGSSRVFVFVDKKGLGHQHGVEAKLLPSTFALGAEKDAGKLVFDMTTFDADTPAARKYVGLSGETDKATRDAVNENMRGEAILNVKKYPKAIFEITSAKATGRLSTRQLPTYVLEGDFTLHGITLPQKILVEVEQVRGWLHIRGSFTINQTAFGITPYSKAFGAIGVADSLKIFGDLYVVPTEHITMTDVPSSQP